MPGGADGLGMGAAWRGAGAWEDQLKPSQQVPHLHIHVWGMSINECDQPFTIPHKAVQRAKQGC